MAGPYADRIPAALAEVTAQLDAVGLRAVRDRGQVNPPGALLQPLSIEETRLNGWAALRAHLYLIAPDRGDASSFDLLTGLLDTALRVVVPAEPVDLHHAVVLPHNVQTPLPAFRLVIDLDL